MQGTDNLCSHPVLCQLCKETDISARPHLVLALGPVPGVVEARPAAQLLLRRDLAGLSSGRALSGSGGGGASFGSGGSCVLLHAADTPELRPPLTGRGGMLGLRLRLQDQVRWRMHDGAASECRWWLGGGLAPARGRVPRGAERAPPCRLTPAGYKPEKASAVLHTAGVASWLEYQALESLQPSASLGARCILLPLTQLLTPPLLYALPLCQAAVPRRRIGFGVAAAAVAVCRWLPACRRTLFAGHFEDAFCCWRLWLTGCLQLLLLLQGVRLLARCCFLRRLQLAHIRWIAQPPELI